MRISVQMFVMLLVCFFGGVSVYIVIGIKYQNVMALKVQHENSVVLVRDTQTIETGLAQWFVTMDLFFSYQQGYLANGIATQAKQLQTIIQAVQANMSELADQGHLFDDIRGGVTSIAGVVTEASKLRKADGEDWHQALADADRLSARLVAELETAFDRVSMHNLLAQNALNTAQKLFYQAVIISLLLYLLLCFTVWRWATITLVRPLETLTARSQQARSRASEHSDDQFVAFDLESGPKELQELGVSFTRFTDQLREEKLRVIVAMEKVSAIMNTAPGVILSVNDKGIIETANHTVTSVFFYPKDHVVDQHIQTLIAEFSLSSVTKNNTSRFECIGIRSDGDLFPIELSASMMQVNGRSEYTLIAQDITLRKDQEKELMRLNQRLMDNSRQAGISEITATILHNVGNVLNSVSTAASVLNQNIRQSRLSRLQKVVALLEEHEHDLPTFFSDNDKAQQLYHYLDVLASQLDSEKVNNRREIEDLQKSVRHIEQIVKSQPHARYASILETVQVDELVEDSLEMHVSFTDNAGIDIVRDYADTTSIRVDRHKLMQIIVNLISNAKEALIEAKTVKPVITITLRNEDNNLTINVTDNGIGMTKITLERIFSFGFTTKPEGHGFGLHSCSLDIKNMGGTLEAFSDGDGKGSTFKLTLPLTAYRQGGRSCCRLTN